MAWLPWHLPELVSDPDQRPLAQFVLFIFALSALLAWLYNSTQASLPVVILLHAAFNSFAQFFLSDLQGEPQARGLVDPGRSLGPGGPGGRPIRRRSLPQPARRRSRGPTRRWRHRSTPVIEGACELGCPAAPATLRSFR
ncbi:MAG: CPBP family glutamic-type intramembrane protease [Nocardioidaceae bacterium]